MKSLSNLEGGASGNLNTRIDFLIKQEKAISYEKAVKIGVLLYVISTAFANGAIVLSESGIASALSDGSMSEERAELAKMLLRQMFSARDGESSKGKQNYMLLQNLLRVIFYPKNDFKGDFKAVLIKESGKYPSFELLGKTIKGSFENRKKGAVMCAVIEYYTPMLIKLLSYAYEFGLSETHKRIKLINKDKTATAYIDNHSDVQTTHLGFHTFRALLRESEYSIFEYHASEIVTSFVTVIEEIEVTLKIKVGKDKF